MISIVTITFNNFVELKNTLESIPEKEFIESIVINGGSDPETAEFLKSYSGISISEKDAGIADAFNKGIKKASGDFIMFLNSGDVLIEPDYIESALSFLNKHEDYSFVHSNIIFDDNIGGEIFMRPQMKSAGRGQPYFHPTMIVRKDCFDKAGYFNTSFKISMDFDFIVRLQKNGLKGKYLDGKAVVKMEGTGKSALSEKEAIEECYRSMKENEFFTLKNRAGFITRKFFFNLRNLMLKLGMKEYLGSLKRIKHTG